MFVCVCVCVCEELVSQNREQRDVISTPVTSAWTLDIWDLQTPTVSIPSSLPPSLHLDDVSSSAALLMAMWVEEERGVCGQDSLSGSPGSHCSPVEVT